MCDVLKGLLTENVGAAGEHWRLVGRLHSTVALQVINILVVETQHPKLQNLNWWLQMQKGRRESRGTLHNRTKQNSVHTGRALLLVAILEYP